MTTETREDQTFDVSKYQIAANSIEDRTLKIEETGEEFAIKVKPLTWARRNQIMSKAITWGASGQTAFDGDVFVVFSSIQDSEWTHRPLESRCSRWESQS